MEIDVSSDSDSLNCKLFRIDEEDFDLDNSSEYNDAGGTCILTPSKLGLDGNETVIHLVLRSGVYEIKNFNSTTVPNLQRVKIAYSNRIRYVNNCDIGILESTDSRVREMQNKPLYITGIFQNYYVLKGNNGDFYEYSNSDGEDGIRMLTNSKQNKIVIYSHGEQFNNDYMYEMAAEMLYKNITFKNSYFPTLIDNTNGRTMNSVGDVKQYIKDLVPGITFDSPGE